MAGRREPDSAHGGRSLPCGLLRKYFCRGLLQKYFRRGYNPGSATSRGKPTSCGISTSNTEALLMRNPSADVRKGGIARACVPPWCLSASSAIGQAVLAVDASSEGP